MENPIESQPFIDDFEPHCWIKIIDSKRKLFTSIQSTTFAKKSEKKLGHIFINQKLSYVQSTTKCHKCVIIIEKIAEIFDENQDEFRRKLRRFWADVKPKLEEYIKSKQGTG